MLRNFLWALAVLVVGVFLAVSVTSAVRLCIPPHGAVCVEGIASGDSCNQRNDLRRSLPGGACDSLETVPGKIFQWWAESFSLSKALESNFGSGLLFFLLEVGLIVVFVPLVLASRSRQAARRNWAQVASNVARDLTILARNLAAVARGDRLDDSDYEYMLGYTDEIESMMVLMGRDLNAFPVLAKAMFELAPLVVRIRRRLTLISSGANSERVHPKAQIDLLVRNAAEFDRRYAKHRAGLEEEAKRAIGDPVEDRMRIKGTYPDSR